MLSSTITLKPVSETGVAFVEIISKQITDGKNRVDSTVTKPSTSSLLIRHQVRGKGPTAAQNHTVSRQVAVPDSNGVLQQLTGSLVLTVADSVVVTRAMVYDVIRQLIDFVASTAPITLDTATIDSLLIGEA
jgi:hypothetical protein